jgi:beta-N-acetylhexosaminidase
VVPAGTETAAPLVGAFDRQYGSIAAVVVTAAAMVVDGLAAHGVTATLKHFPGLGRVQRTTDTSPDVVDSTTTAGDEQVAAFARLARSRAHPFVMASSATILPAMIDAVLARSDGDPDFAAQVDAAVHTALMAKARAGLLPG